MTESNTVASTKQAATRAVAQMSRPEGMTRVTWAGVQAVLGAIARSYPKAYPSQVNLAARLDIPVRSVRRYIAAAVAANLLVVEADAGAAPRKQMGSLTNRYWVKLASNHEANLDPQETTSYSVGGSVFSSQKTSSSVPRTAAPSGPQDPPESSEPSQQRSTVVSMHEYREPERDVGAPAAPIFQRRSKRPPRREGDADAIVSAIDSRRRKTKRAPKPPPEWKRLGDYFAVLWQQMQQTTGQHKDTRGLESYRQVRTYVAAHFADRSELEIRKLMEEFVVAVSKYDITIKPGQSAWMCFTGAWGRQRHVEVDDPYAIYKKGAQT